MRRRQFITTLAAGAGAVLSSCKKSSESPKIKSEMSSAPSADFIQEPARDIPVMAHTDVLVIGGGPAGVAAAVAAGRTGADVLMVERYNHLGGLWTGGLVLPLLSTHATDENGKFRRVLYGIGGEIEQRLREMGMAIHPVNAVIDPEAGKYVMDVMVRDAGVRMLYHAWAGNIIVEDNTIKAVMVETKSGRGAIIPKVVIDCTGDGDLMPLAGESFRHMDFEVGLVHRLGNTHMVDKSKPGYKKLEIGGETPIKGVNWVNMITGDHQNVLDAWNLSRMQQQYRIDIWETFKKIKETPGYEDLFILDTASQIGTRMSRMLDGQYILTQKDTMTYKTFDDVIAISGAWTSIPYEGKRVPMRQRPLWQIPYRSLVPKKTKNLLIAGRCYSYEQKLFQDSRIIGTCLLTGHAAGAAASVAVKDMSAVQNTNVSKIQDVLKSQNAWLG